MLVIYYHLVPDLQSDFVISNLPLDLLVIVIIVFMRSIFTNRDQKIQNHLGTSGYRTLRIGLIASSILFLSTNHDFFSLEYAVIM